ncbi:amino acid ABC transporter permease [Burkholderia sp. L27(2015)]|uniref:amino acid ABC transporter permease n=1 Tax=Burkholderia sp. L27(2015) TaxID=1641858 RepID=UPI00131BD58D|nr:amino acid ABC transporter permease [Burkholderia sp. L27(2015)]
MNELFLPIASYLLRGFGITLLIAILSIALATPLGLVLGLMTQSQNRASRLVARNYIEALRGIPSLMTLLFVFFALPKFGIETSPIAASILGLSVWSAANIAEVARGALSSIAAGQTVASRALGMNQSQALIWVIFPQALRRFIPPYVSQLTLLIQASTLTSVVGVTDLLGSARQMIERLAYVRADSDAIMIYGCVMLLFFIVCFPLTLLAQALEARARSE